MFSLGIHQGQLQKLVKVRVRLALQFIMIKVRVRFRVRLKVSVRFKGRWFTLGYENFNDIFVGFSDACIKPYLMYHLRHIQSIQFINSFLIRGLCTCVCSNAQTRGNTHFKCSCHLAAVYTIDSCSQLFHWMCFTFISMPSSFHGCSPVAIGNIIIPTTRN